MNKIEIIPASSSSNRGVQVGGFNLIELLVVIAIIAIVTATLLPALGRAGNRDQLAIDLNNNKQIMQAMTMYTANNREYLPYPAWGTRRDSWCYGANIVEYGNSATTVATFPICYNNQLVYFRKSQLYPYLKEPKVLLCPADEPNGLYYQRSIYITSYVWNGAICDGEWRITTKITNARFKPDCILQWEIDEQLPFYFNDGSSYPDEGISTRHGTGAIVGLIGGGAEQVRYADWYTDRYAGALGQRGQAIPPGDFPTRLWYSPGNRFPGKPGLF